MADVSVLRCLAGYWNVTVYGRKHCYRLYTKLLNEATRWSSAIQNVTDTKAPIDTPTQQLIQDIKVGREAQEFLVVPSLAVTDASVSPAWLPLMPGDFSVQSLSEVFREILHYRCSISIEVLEFGTLCIDRRLCVNWVGTA